MATAHPVTNNHARASIALLRHTAVAVLLGLRRDPYHRDIVRGFSQLFYTNYNALRVRMHLCGTLLQHVYMVMPVDAAAAAIGEWDALCERRTKLIDAVKRGVTEVRPEVLAALFDVANNNVDTIRQLFRSFVRRMANIEGVSAQVKARLDALSA